MMMNNHRGATMTSELAEKPKISSFRGNFGIYDMMMVNKSLEDFKESLGEYALTFHGSPPVVAANIPGNTGFCQTFI